MSPESTNRIICKQCVMVHNTVPSVNCPWLVMHSNSSSARLQTAICAHHMQGCCIGEALGSLSTLTQLKLGAATRSLVATVTPLFPCSHLANISITARDAEIAKNNENVALAFAQNAQHLTALKQLVLDTECCGDGAVGKIAALIGENTELVFVNLKLCGGMPSTPAGPLPAMTCDEQRTLFSSIAGLPGIQQVTLAFDVWYELRHIGENALACMHHMDSDMHDGAADLNKRRHHKHARSLARLYLNVAPVPSVGFSDDERYAHGPGDIVTHSLLNLPLLQVLCCQDFAFRAKDVRPLCSISCVPNLTDFTLIDVTMSITAAQLFAQALGRIKLPGLWCFRLQVAPPRGVPFREYYLEQSGDGVLRRIVENLPELPSLQVCTELLFLFF